MEEFFENIFVRVGLIVLVVALVVYCSYKWLIPFIIKQIKELKKRKKNKREYEQEQKFNQVEIVTKDVEIPGIKKQEIELSAKLKEFDYIPAEQLEEKLELNVKEPSKGVEEDAEFKSFLNEINREKNTVKSEIRKTSPKLKGIILSGVLQDKKF